MKIFQPDKKYAAIENAFITDYMPVADGDFVKVYLYMLSLTDRESSIDTVASCLGLDKTIVERAVEYWTDLGLIERFDDTLCFLSVSDARRKIKKYDVDKYSAFNKQLESMLPEREILPEEYRRYYDLMEDLRIDWEAMAAIIGYCVRLKGNTISCNYILTVARNLARSGARTFDQISEQLEAYSVYSQDLNAIFARLSLKSKPDIESVTLYKKWTVKYKIPLSVIIKVAEQIKRGGINGLDVKLTEYYELGFNTFEQIDEYEQNRTLERKLCKKINRALGVYYESTDNEAETFIRPWTELGFSDSALICIANNCFKNDMRTLSAMDVAVKEFYAKGLLTTKAIEDDIANQYKFDSSIQSIMKKLGLTGAVLPIYRRYYVTWATQWNIALPLLDEAARLSIGKANPFAYMNSILAAWHEQNINSVEQVKGSVAAAKNPRKEESSVTTRYTADELNQMFTMEGEDDSIND